MQKHCPICTLPIIEPNAGCPECNQLVPWEQPGGLAGRLFGACLGAGVTIPAWLVIGPNIYANRGGDMLGVGLLWVLCATVLGAYTGGAVRGRDHRRRTLLIGILGPSLTAIGLFGTCYALFLYPFFLAFSLPAVAFCLPAAYLTERFNDPACWTPGRRRAWLRAAIISPLLGLLLTWILYGPLLGW